MDPQSAAFTPRDDVWRFQSDMLRVQQTQSDHGERLSRLERRQDEDARMKSVWGTSSPFPGVLSGTPQQGPVQQPLNDAFSGFDDQSSNLIGSLHLDADEEPRRTGATSRANSVRFDETANQGHWSHASRTSIDLIPRSTSSLGSHPMLERTYSHKSDGRQSSAGHSVHSGRANSLGIDSQFGAIGQSTSPLDHPGLAPGLFVLGTVPSIIRCWLNTNFKHDSLLYAAVCTGSYGSFLDQRLIDRLGFTDQIRKDDSRKIKLLVYLPEAITRTPSSRSNSPAPQLPTITVDFNVINATVDDQDKSIQIFIGSDVLRTHNADVLLSSNTITLFDDDHNKLTIPMVRPENEQTFKGLYTISKVVRSPDMFRKSESGRGNINLLNGLKQTESVVSTSGSAIDGSGRQSIDQSPRIEPGDKAGRQSFGDDASTTSTRQSFESRPSLSTLSTSVEGKTSSETNTANGTPRSGASPMIWGNWRRDGDKANTQADSWSKSSYQRRNEGIKVLRPIKSASRTFSTTSATANAPSPVGQSRFFGTSNDGASDTKTTAPTEKDKDSGVAVPKTRTANPVGGASAFAWLSK
ncbi:cysteine proteinase [Venturia nashicola]|uniref:Cysteine proteinase n=1 Tax=Venturia nashicola TaxID=86259 RepID=A0A4Z1P146_9PEZI|nr:cysteine proteinase [Venturia nashicola]